jgi:hypothetical protein
MLDSAWCEIVSDALLSPSSMIRCKDEWREVGYEKPLRLSGELRFAVVGARSMVADVVPLIGKIIFFQCDDKK